MKVECIYVYDLVLSICMSYSVDEWCYHNYDMQAGANKTSYIGPTVPLQKKMRKQANMPISFHHYGGRLKRKQKQRGFGGEV